MKSLYLPNVILGALDAIGPKPFASEGLVAYYRWRDARRSAIEAITNYAFVFVILGIAGAVGN